MAGVPWLASTGWNGDWPAYQGWIARLYPGEADYESGSAEDYPAEIVFEAGGSPGNLKELTARTIDVSQFSAEDAILRVRDVIVEILAQEGAPFTRYTIRASARIFDPDAGANLADMPGDTQEGAATEEPNEPPTTEDDAPPDLSELDGGTDPETSVASGTPTEPDEVEAEATDVGPAEDPPKILWEIKGYLQRSWQRTDANAVSAQPPPAARGVFGEGRVPPPPTPTMGEVPGGTAVAVTPPSYAGIPAALPQTSRMGEMPPFPAWNQIPAVDPALISQNPQGVLVSTLGVMTVTVLGEHRFLVEQLAQMSERMLDMHRATLDTVQDMHRAAASRDDAHVRERVQAEKDRRAGERARETERLAELRQAKRDAEARALEATRSVTAVTSTVTGVEERLATRIEQVAADARRRPVIPTPGVGERLLNKVGTLGEVVVDRVAAQVAAAGVAGGTPGAGGAPGWIQRQIRLADGTVQVGWFPASGGPPGGAPAGGPPGGAPAGAPPSAPTGAPPSGAPVDFAKNPDLAAAMLSLMSEADRRKILEAWARRDPTAAYSAAEHLGATLGVMEEEAAASGSGTDAESTGGDPE